MVRLKLWLLCICIILILLDKFSFINQYRDYLAVSYQKKISSVIHKIVNYPKLILLQSAEQNNLEKENTELKKQIESYSILLKQQNNHKQDVEHFKALGTLLTLYDNYSILIARAIIDINYLINDKVLIDQGSKSNIVVGSAVINQNGVIGQISFTSDKISQVTLITNPNFQIYLQTQNGKNKMLAQGIGGNSLIVKYINKDVKIGIGDILVTTGLDDVYPADLPVARVKKVFYENNGFNSAICDPVVNFNKLQFIAILKNAAK